MNASYAWSRDGERYTGEFPTIEEAFCDAEDDGVANPYIGTAEPPMTPEGFVDAEFVIEHITCQDDYRHDFADGWPNATADQMHELTESLQKVVGEWLDRHKLRGGFFLVWNAKRYTKENGTVVELKD